MKRTTGGVPVHGAGVVPLMTGDMRVVARVNGRRSAVVAAVVTTRKFGVCRAIRMRKPAGAAEVLRMESIVGRLLRNSHARTAQMGRRMHHGGSRQTCTHPEEVDPLMEEMRQVAMVEGQAEDMEAAMEAEQTLWRGALMLDLYSPVRAY
jgi:hypothetical protein